MATHARCAFEVDISVVFSLILGNINQAHVSSQLLSLEEEGAGVGRAACGVVLTGDCVGYFL